MLDWGDNQDSEKEQRELFGNTLFDYTKPIKLIYNLVKSLTEKDDIILDFFAGSSTTAHAVMQLMIDEDTNRSFIMVQLPEICSDKSDAKKVGYDNICKIGIDRIYRAGKKLKEKWLKDNQGEGLFVEEKEFPYDIGFKVFKLDSTNIKPWDNESKMDSQSLFDLSEVFKEGRSKEDVLYEIMLKYGVFDMQASEIEINGKTMYLVGKRYMMVCLEDDVTSEDVEAIAEFSPKTVVFKEVGFNNDNDKINAVYNLEKEGVEDIKCI